MVSVRVFPRKSSLYPDSPMYNWRVSPRNFRQSYCVIVKSTGSVFAMHSRTRKIWLPNCETSFALGCLRSPRSQTCERRVSDSFLERSQEVAADRLTDDRCLVAEGALFFCHRADMRGFFVGELAQKVNQILIGRHEERAVTARKIGGLLKELGIRKEVRVAKGCRVSLTDAVRKKIHDQARAYGVTPAGNELVKCSHCIKEEGLTN